MSKGYTAVAGVATLKDFNRRNHDAQEYSWRCPHCHQEFTGQSREALENRANFHLESKHEDTSTSVNLTKDYKEITLSPDAKFLGNSETLERKVSVWRIRGQIYVTDVKYVLDVWGYPMGLREAPYAVAQEFKSK